MKGKAAWSVGLTHVLAQIIWLSLFQNLCFCQDVGYRNAMYFEFAGNADAPLSLNYERRLHEFAETHYTVATRIGGAISSIGDEEGTSFSIPLEAIVIHGHGKHMLDGGVGPTLVINVFKDSPSGTQFPSQTVMIPIARVGYRYCANSGFILRAAPIAAIPISSTDTWRFSLGIACGFRF